MNIIPLEGTGGNEYVKLVWATPQPDKLIEYLARVSNPSAQANSPRQLGALIAYMLRQQHWSPFEMVNLCMEVNTTRDIGRQVLRHGTFKFQEFSQRYAATDALPRAHPRPARAQDSKNRQNSLPGVLPSSVEQWWIDIQNETQERDLKNYRQALDFGIAKEVARGILGEGLTMTRFYMNGNARSWMHFCSTRMAEGVQLENKALAQQAWNIFKKRLPTTARGFMLALEQSGVVDISGKMKLDRLVEFMTYNIPNEKEATPEYS